MCASPLSSDDRIGFWSGQVFAANGVHREKPCHLTTRINSFARINNQKMLW